MKRFKIGSHSYTLSESTLFVSDSAGAYDHPEILLVYIRDDDDDKVCVWIRFQRDRDRPADRSVHMHHALRTRVAWSATYAGEVMIKEPNVRLLDAPFQWQPDDQLRMKIARVIARRIREKNIYYKFPHCEASRTLEALDSFKIRPLIDLHENAPAVGQTGRSPRRGQL